jgi:hypothetical protein
MRFLPRLADFGVLPLLPISARDRGSTGTRGAVAQLGERLNGIQEVDGSTPFSSTLHFARRKYMRSWHLMLVLAALCSALFLGAGCSSRQPEPSTADYRGIERPARPVLEEDSSTETAGEIAVVILAVAVAGALIALPFIFLF